MGDISLFVLRMESIFEDGTITRSIYQIDSLFGPCYSKSEDKIKENSAKESCVGMTMRERAGLRAMIMVTSEPRDCVMRERKKIKERGGKMSVVSQRGRIKRVMEGGLLWLFDSMGKAADACGTPNITLFYGCYCSVHLMAIITYGQSRDNEGKMSLNISSRTSIMYTSLHTACSSLILQYSSSKIHTE